MEMKIKLNSMDEVKEFVSIASQCDFDIDIFYNRIIIDGKSLLGILSMDLNQDLNVRCYGKADAFMEQIAKFAVKNAVA